MSECWREKVGPVVMLLLTSLLIGASIGFASRAGAEPSDTALEYAQDNAWRICLVLDDYPSFAGITGIGEAIHEEGLSYYDAGQAIALSVYGVCPEHTGLIKAYAAAGKQGYIV